jgi:hypothetical protein
MQAPLSSVTRSLGATLVMQSLLYSKLKQGWRAGAPCRGFHDGRVDTKQRQSLVFAFLTDLRTS